MKQHLATSSKWQLVRDTCRSFAWGVLWGVLCGILAATLWITPQVVWAEDTPDLNETELKTYHSSPRSVGCHRGQRHEA